MANLRGLVVPIGGDPSGLLRALNKSEKAAQQFTRQIGKTGATAQQSARLQVQAAVKTEARLRSEVAEYKRLAAAAASGSRQQVAAARLAAQAQQRLARSTAVSARESRQLAAAAARTDRSFRQGARGAVAGSGALRSLGRSIAFASGAYLGTAGLVFGIKSAISAASDFDNSLQKIIGLAGGSEKQVKQFRGQLLALAPAVGTAPKELADALYFVASAGIDASHQMEVVRVSAQAAAAGLGNTETVADAVTSAMNAYGQKNLSAAQATDVLVATVREGKGEAAAFAPVIGNVAAFAAQLGVSFNDVGAALAAETKLGVDAQTAAVQLQAIFSGLVKTTPKAEKALHSVGLSSGGLRKELREKGLLSVLNTLREHFQGNTRAIAQAFPNIRALRGLFALTGKSADQTIQIFNRLQKAGGSRQIAFGAVAKDADFQFRRFNAALKVTQVTIGAALAPAAAKAAAGIADWLSKTRNQRRLQHDVNVVMRTAGRIIRGLAAAFRLMVRVVTPVIGALGGVERAATIMFTAFAVTKVLRLTRSLRGLRAALFGVAEAEAAVTGGGLLGGGGLIRRAGRTARLAAVLRGGALGAAAGLGAGTVAAGVVVGGAVVTAGGGGTHLGDRSKKYPRVYALFARVGSGQKPTAQEQRALNAIGQYSLDNAPDSKLAAAEAILTGKRLRGTAAGANVSDRAPGRSPTGAAGPAAAAVAAAAGAGGGGGGGGGRHRASLTYQISLLEEQLAKAELTASKKDDRATLQRLAGLTRQKIAKTKDLQERTQLYQQLGGYESQIAQIDQEATTKQQAAHKKQNTARKKARDDALKALNERETHLKDQIKTIQGEFKGAVETARQGIGELFTGPVLNPSDDDRRRILGAPDKRVDVKSLTADLRAQTAQFAANQRNLATLAKRGAPKQLLDELRGKGLDAAPEIAALAKAKPAQLKAFFKAFGAREQLAIRTARTTMHSRLVTLHAARVQLRLTRAQEGRLRDNRPIHVHTEVKLNEKVVAEAVTVRQQRHERRTAAQRGSRRAGRSG